MKERTYRYFTGEPLYPFGYGLSYTRFQYSDLNLNTASLADGESLTLSVTVANVGSVAGDEVAQVYISAGRSGYPLRQLAAFERVHLEAGAAQTLTFMLPSKQFTRVLENGQRILESGAFTVFVGGGQPGWTEGIQMKIEVRV